ncbi:NCS2 family permease [Blautia obeum]|uniref:NCS2 family permease n=1 Tax=Blautia obeum TaxID=40520 RepID=A0A412KWF8_9FIRM|nr:NCS2 family permease [Blautia obeum]RGI91568.1 NCS2 family permease [Blautia obeum]RGR49656.1 NCS2 family permease [Blautia obeum]RGS73096.1 NCS2 family permease [Blautia obeum]RGZ08240.1 NCS2 family permease [Blautia obeum]RHB10730.1 NCS2 family permease [Blautia obeum]
MNLDKIFHLKENHTDVKTEVMAGITTFMTMAYILAVNPNILSASGMDRGSVFTATALSAFIATCLMALLSNYPFVLAPGMGLNAYFTYTVVLGMGYTWQQALAAVFAEGIIFILLSLTNVREAIFNSIPMNLKHAVSVGIGLFIAFIGLQNAKIVVGNDSTLVSIFSFKSSVAEGTFSSQGITVLLALIGILVTAVLLAKDVKGSILWGILITWVLGIICQLTHLYVPNADIGYYSLLPDFSNGISVPSMAPTFMKMDFSIVFSLDFVVIMFAFLFVDMFDTLGTLIGVASKADMLDKDGKLPKIKGALLSDAVGTTVGAVCGTSTVTTFVESASGVAEGGRTGLTSIVAGILFALSLLLSPIFLAIPSFATAPALIVVGYLMLTSVTKIDFSDMTEAIPCFIAIIAMPFMYSISEGISMGVISYVVINVITGKAKEKKISLLMYILAVLFILKYIFL